MIYIGKNNQQFGPFSEEEIRQRISGGEFSPSDLGWREGMTSWRPLSEMFSTLPPPVFPNAASSATPAPGSVRADSPAVTQASGLAIVSLVLGILGLPLSIVLIGVLFGLAAIITGHIARSRIKASAGQVSGSGMALAGLILGYLSLPIPILAIAASLAIPIFKHDAVQQRLLSVQCTNNAKQIGLACRIYAQDHDGKFPDTLEQLYPNYLSDRKVLSCPFEKDSAETGYDYFGAKLRPETRDPKDVLLRAKHGPKNGTRAIVHEDGSAEMGP